MSDICENKQLIKLITPDRRKHEKQQREEVRHILLINREVFSLKKKTASRTSSSEALEDPLCRLLHCSATHNRHLQTQLYPFLNSNFAYLELIVWFREIGSRNHAILHRKSVRHISTTGSTKSEKTCDSEHDM